jgi:Surfeit locus protein 2 (SURF2)
MSTKSLAELLEEQKEYIALTETGTRIRCIITGHEMPARADAVLSHLNGKKFRKAKEWYSQDYSKYEPFLVQDGKNPSKLFCKLTRLRINKIPLVVEKHTNGKRFLRLKQIYIEREAKRAKNGGSGEEEEDEDEDEEDEEEDEVEAGEDDLDDLDVEKEIKDAAAAGVWMPASELRAIVDGLKTAKPNLKRKHTSKGRKAQDKQEEDEEDEDEEDEEAAHDVDDIDSDDSDADLKYYIRSAPEPAAKRKNKASKNHPASASAPAAAASSTEAKSKSKDKDKGKGKGSKQSAKKAKTTM